MRGRRLALAVGVACGAAAAGCDGAHLGGAPGDDEVVDATPAPEPDAGELVVLGEPITVAPEDLERWVWIPIPTMRCADGTPAGVGVNFTDRSRELVIWFQGNGVCYDLKSCALFQHLLVGMGPDPLDHLWWSDPDTSHTGIFDRDDPDNPFRDASYVALPHCTLDGHTADKASTYPPLPTYQQRGYKNATEALARIAATFPDATRVTVAGFSAGAIGATANYHKIAATFEALGQPPPFLIADAGPLLREPYLSGVARDALIAGWGLEATVGAWCTECVDEGPSGIYEALARRHPGLRASVLCAYGDTVVLSLYRLLDYDLTIWDGDKLRRGLLDLDHDVQGFQPAVAPSAQRELFYPGDRHGALVVAPLSGTPGLVPFLHAQLAGDPGWATVLN